MIVEKETMIVVDKPEGFAYNENIYEKNMERKE